MDQYNNINQCVKSFFCKNDNKVNIFSILATLFNISMNDLVVSIHIDFKQNYIQSTI